MSREPQPGDWVGNYAIQREIGRGGMGVVYEARQKFPSRQVALKVLPPFFAEDLDFRRRFVRESEMAAQIDHPNIIPIYEAGEDQGLLFLAMRYVFGPDLKALIRSNGRLEAARTLGLIGQVASALDTAHASGLVHRDVKPANILVSSVETSEREHVYLTDFGLTKRTDTSTALTRSGQFVGSLDYVAPEQIRGEPVGPATDIYALGCVLFEALAGAPPFRRETEVALIYAHLQEPPPSLRKLRGDLPSSIDDVTARALAKRPEDRPRSATDFVAEIRAALETKHPVLTLTRPAATRPQHRPQKFNKEVRPVRPGLRGLLIPVATLALVGAALFAGFVYASFRSETDPKSPRTVATPPTSSPETIPSPEETPESTGVVAERPRQAIQLFNSAIQAPTPWFNDIERLYEGYPLDHVVAEASLLGAWWALADWCETTGRPLNSCYDLAAEYADEFFGRDPRTINDDTWGSPGAIGAVIDEGYDRTASYLGQPTGGSGAEDRPGVVWLCEPSCVEAPH